MIKARKRVRASHRPNLPGKAIGILLAASLAACQSLPQTPLSLSGAANEAAIGAAPVPAASSIPAARPLNFKAGQLENPSFSAALTSNGSYDRLVISLGKSIRPLKRPFHAQAADTSELAFVRVSVTGPGITTPLTHTGGLIDISSGTPSVEIASIPRGKNRVVTAQFYNALSQPVANAVAMGVFSSGADLNIKLRRRYLPMGLILQRLQATSQGRLVAVNLDIAALQAKIDKLLYEPDPAPEPVDPSVYDKDPVLINTAQIVADLLALQGNVNDLSLNASHIKQVAVLDLPITGLIASDLVIVRVDDPTSPEVIFSGSDILANGGKVTVPNVSPGNWPVFVYNNSNVNFLYPESTYQGNPLPLVYRPGSIGVNTSTPLSAQPLAFSAGVTTTAATYALKPATPTLSTAAGLWTRSGLTLTLAGSSFYPDAGTSVNQVRFARTPAVGAPIEVIAGASSDGNSLSLTIPAAGNGANQFPEAGLYSVSVTVGGSDVVQLGQVMINVLAVKPGAAAFATGSSDGLGWERATRLSDALAAATAGNEIWVAQGTHTPGTLRADTFQLKTDVAVYGGFTGTETSLTARDYVSNPTILSGDIDGVADVYDTDASNGLSHSGIAGNSYHVVKGVTGATLDGFTIRGGNANASANDDRGAGMLNQNADPALNNLSFSGNTAVFGAGLFNDVSNPALNNVTFSANSATNQGGGSYSLFSTPAMTKVFFIGNAATSRGGGLYNFNPGSGSALTEVVFRGNTTPGDGGAMFNDASNPILTNVIFSGNTASGNGGGYYNLSGNPKLVNTTFQANTASSGGGIFAAAGSPVLVNLLLWNSSLSGLALPGGQGNVQAGSDPFVNSSDPDGADGSWFSADDGLQPSIVASTVLDQGLASFGGVSIPAVDVRGTVRPQGAAHDPGAYELVYQTLGLGTGSGKSGDQVVITGANLTGATAVRFNGRDAADFTVDSPGQITARVPFGSVTTGKVTVSAPNGTGRSSGNFTITSRIHLARAAAVGSDSGNNWTNAHPSLQTALLNALSGDEIWVAAGIYKPGSLRADTFTLKSGVPVYGGFAGSETIRSARDFNTNISILSGDILGDDNAVTSTGDANRGENSHHVVTVSSASTTLDGLTIKGGHAISGATDGGGMFIGPFSATLSNLIFRNNTAVNGGGLFLNGASTTLSNVSFLDNASTSSGAGVFSQNSGTPSLSNVLFKNNACVNGGGIYVSSGTVTLSNGQFIGNSATGGLGGGGMYSGPGASANVSKAVFVGNNATNGGGYYTFTSSPTLTNVIFTGNSATTQGGGFFNNSGGNPKLVNVTFNSNTAGSGGSALYNSSGSPVFVNVLLWNNVLGNITLPGSQGNVQAGSDPFADVTDPVGDDLTWFSSDDGLRLSSSADLGIASFGGVTFPTVDVLGVSRPQNGVYDSGAYEKPFP